MQCTHSLHFECGTGITNYVKHFLSPSYWINIQIYRWFEKKKLLQEGLSEHEFYGDLVYKFSKIVAKTDFSYSLKRLLFAAKKIGDNMDTMRQTARMIVNLIMFDNAYLFNYTAMSRSSDHK